MNLETMPVEQTSTELFSIGARMIYDKQPMLAILFTVLKLQRSRDACTVYSVQYMLYYYTCRLLVAKATMYMYTELALFSSEGFSASCSSTRTVKNCYKNVSVREYRL